MSDFLLRVAERQLGFTRGIEPRVVSVFAPRQDNHTTEFIAGDAEPVRAPAGEPEAGRHAPSKPETVYDSARADAIPEVVLQNVTSLFDPAPVPAAPMARSATPEVPSAISQREMVEL